eukprot:CAMPEP_0172190588 /NCGR_PEP_ID=MMETSP1050-20130122/23202_1 /TAXON_ID=233186 /ORGANISM="Cryptomonas curvata, Strain CCAP979/52" /LENGTH=132 /DNA_ID=CAMNT_0012865489 /DNA_START=177 /DNA_END=576 /DNA_ORIENTATION=+
MTASVCSPCQTATCSASAGPSPSPTAGSTSFQLDPSSCGGAAPMAARNGDGDTAATHGTPHGAAAWGAAVLAAVAMLVACAAACDAAEHVALLIARLARGPRAVIAAVLRRARLTSAALDVTRWEMAAARDR